MGKQEGVLGPELVSALCKPFLVEFRGEPTWTLPADTDGPYTALSSGCGIRWQLSGLFYRAEDQRNYLVEVIVKVRLAESLPEMASFTFSYRQLRPIYAGTRIEVLSEMALWDFMKESSSMEALRERCKRDLRETRTSNRNAA